MSVDWQDGRYIESEDDPGFGTRLRQAFRRGWTKSSGKASRGATDGDDEAFGLEGALRAELRPGGRWLPILLTVVALAAFATVIWYAYNWGKGSLDTSALPVITGDGGPVKVRPADEGGVEIPDQDKLIFDSGLDGSLDGGKGGTVEHLLPAPEEPVDLSSVAARQESAAAAGLGHQLSASPQAGGTLPSTVVTVEEVLPPSVPADNAAQGQDVIAQAIEKEAAMAAAPAGDTGSAPVPAPAPKPTAVQTAQVPTDSGYLLQLAATQDAASAKKEWARLQKAFPQLLGGRSLTVEKAEVSGTTYYRILTGPFPTKETVEDICTQLKAKKQSCLVKKRAP